jgi:hypothetical protein
MKRLAVLGGTFVMLFALAGCGSDPRDEAVTAALNLFKDAAGNTRSVKAEIAKAVDAAQKANRKLTAKDFKAAEETAKRLREVGKKLLTVKGDIEILQENTTPAQKERLDERYGDELQGLVNRFQAEQKDLDAVLARAEAAPHEPGVMTQLRKAIDESREEFRILTKPH